MCVCAGATRSGTIWRDAKASSTDHILRRARPLRGASCCMIAWHWHLRLGPGSLVCRWMVSGSDLDSMRQESHHRSDEGLCAAKSGVGVPPSRLGSLCRRHGDTTRQAHACSAAICPVEEMHGRKADRSTRRRTSHPGFDIPSRVCVCVCDRRAHRARMSDIDQTSYV